MEGRVERSDWALENAPRVKGIWATCLAERGSGGLDCRVLIFKREVGTTAASKE